MQIHGTAVTSVNLNCGRRQNYFQEPNQQLEALMVNIEARCDFCLRPAFTLIARLHSDRSLSRSRLYT